MSIPGGGTQFTKKTFSVPASAGDKKTCEAQGHAFADRKGKCVRCGEKVRPDGYNSDG